MKLSCWGFDFFFGSFDLYQDKRNEHELVAQRHLDFLHFNQNLRSLFALRTLLYDIICLGHAKRGVSGSLFPKSAIAGLNSYRRQDR